MKYRYLLHLATLGVGIAWFRSNFDVKIDITAKCSKKWAEESAKIGEEISKGFEEGIKSVKSAFEKEKNPYLPFDFDEKSRTKPKSQEEINAELTRNMQKTGREAAERLKWELENCCCCDPRYIPASEKLYPGEVCDGKDEWSDILGYSDKLHEEATQASLKHDIHKKMVFEKASEDSETSSESVSEAAKDDEKPLKAIDKEALEMVTDDEKIQNLMDGFKKNEESWWEFRGPGWKLGDPDYP